MLKSAAVSRVVVASLRSWSGRTRNICVVDAIRGPRKGSLVPIGLRVAQMGLERGNPPLFHAGEVFVHGGLDTLAMILQAWLGLCRKAQTGCGLFGPYREKLSGFIPVQLVRSKAQQKIDIGLHVRVRHGRCGCGAVWG
jgi:hypothetical protein